MLTSYVIPERPDVDESSSTQVTQIRFLLGVMAHLMSTDVNALYCREVTILTVVVLRASVSLLVNR